MSDQYNPVITEETFAAWLDGTLSYEHENLFLEFCSNNKELQDLLDANDQIDEDYENMIDVGYDLPYEFNSDFEIPSIGYSTENDDIYSDEQIEIYDQDEDSDDLMDYDKTELEEDDSAVGNCTLTGIGNEDFDII